jgi:hypothetical protein
VKNLLNPFRRKRLLFLLSRGVQNNRLTEKTEKTEEKLTEKTEPK